MFGGRPLDGAQTSRRRRHVAADSSFDHCRCRCRSSCEPSPLPAAASSFPGACRAAAPAHATAGGCAGAAAASARGVLVLCACGEAAASALAGCPYHCAQNAYSAWRHALLPGMDGCRMQGGSREHATTQACLHKHARSRHAAQHARQPQCARAFLLRTLVTCSVDVRRDPLLPRLAFMACKTQDAASLSPHERDGREWFALALAGPLLSTICTALVQLPQVSMAQRGSCKHLAPEWSCGEGCTCAVQTGGMAVALFALPTHYGCSNTALAKACHCLAVCCRMPHLPAWLPEIAADAPGVPRQATCCGGVCCAVPPLGQHPEWACHPGRLNAWQRWYACRSNAASCA